MNLSKYTVKYINNNNIKNIPEGVFDLPEKVLQFGTGVLLRGLPDYFIDKANRNNIFNGRVVVVKSTNGGDTEAFEKQDSLYTLCIRGVQEGKLINENIICSAISRVLSANNNWADVLACAHNPTLQIIISNTTEVGIALVNDDIKQFPPISFPGKLLAFLYHRYTVFNGSNESGMVIIPTELISNNGKKLESIVFELAHLNGLEENFIDWLEKNITFCNSLVDRIVPGKPDTTLKESLNKTLGYNDELITISEVYRLWAIEGNEKVKNILSFAKADDGVVVTHDINLFKELKLRLLNGTHTLSCAVAFFANIKTVNEAMDNPEILNFINELMKNEIAKAIPYPVLEKDTQAFAQNVIDRFSNKSIEHLWLNITLNFTSKIEMRVVQVLLNYYNLYKRIPQNIAIGFAAYILFMHPKKIIDNKYFGTFNNVDYPINDIEAIYFKQQWENYNVNQIVKNVLSNVNFWKADLSIIDGFVHTVSTLINNIENIGMIKVLQKNKI